MPKKKFTIKLKHPNPLFEEWLIEWRDKAIETNSKMQYCYGKALESLQKYPLPLESGKDCIILQGFGEKLCMMLDDKLAEYKRVNPNFTRNTATHQVDKKSPRAEYIPKLRSGAWAILITLYKQSLTQQYPGFLHKPEIVKHAQCLCDKSFIKPDPGSYYTAWSSMKTLIEKELVTKVSSPAKYSLTDNGVVLSYKLYRHNLNQENFVPETKTTNNVIDDISTNHNTTMKPKKLSGSRNKKKSSSNSLPKSNSLSSGDVDSQASSDLSHQETFILAPYSFNVILLVDKMEVAGNRHALDDSTLSELTHLNVAYEVRHLKVGDYTWICREHDTNRELVLPYIIERKRMDDLGGSIKDGRFHEQKFRLKQCGLKNLIYLIESIGNNSYAGLPLATLEQAAINTLVHDGFSVKFTDNAKATVKYFAVLTNILKNLYMNKTLVSCPKENISEAVEDDDLLSLITFEEFNRGASKNKHLKVQDMFVRMLLQLKGVSVDKALAIVEKYPTPQLLWLCYSQSDDLINEKLLANLEYGQLNKKIGPVISKTVYQLFRKVQY